jgi:hypothetical protein
VTQQTSRLNKWGRRWAQAVTLIILLNLILVFFNLTYIPLRQIYNHYVPELVQIYDPIKAIEPHPVTENYLSEIETLRSRISQTGLTSEATTSSLANLRQQSTTLIAENPFLASGRVTAFARLKRYIRQFTGEKSAEAAFQKFWQVDYLQQIGWLQADQFIEKRLTPLLSQNYFRETFPTGQFVDEFWRIDLFFIVLFGSEFLVRTFVLSRIRNDISWGAALARRWYELPLFLPFWQWLRLLPAGVRLHRTGIIDVENLIGQVTHEPAAYLADRISKFAIVRLINQTQRSVQTGTLLQTGSSISRQLNRNELAKLDQLTDRLVQLIVLQVMPQVKPDLEHLLRHSLHKALLEGEVYRNLPQLPGLESLPGEALDGIADYLAQASCDVLASSYTDQKGRMLLDQLSRDFRHTLGKELQSKNNSQELRILVSDLLETLKINYIQRSEQEDPETTLQEVNVLDRAVDAKSG